MTFRKGSRRHGIAGNIFFVSMLTMSAAGVYLALMKHQTSNVFGGLLTFYLVATAWTTARRGDGETRFLDWVALLVATAVAAVIASFGFEALKSATETKDGVSAGIYFMLSSVALICAAGDLRMVLRGGLFGVHRIARHLWRICFALYIASASVFLARAQIFPEFLRKTHVIFLLGILPLPLMVFWLVRVQLTTAFKNKRPAPGLYATGSQRQNRVEKLRKLRPLIPGNTVDTAR